MRGSIRGALDADVFVVDYGDGVFEIRRYVAGGVEGLVE